MNINLLKSAAVAEGNFLVSALLNSYIEDTNIKSPAATNGKILIINPNLFDELDTAQQYGTLCHEARHIMFKHKEIEEQLGLKHDLYSVHHNKRLIDNIRVILPMWMVIEALNAHSTRTIRSDIQTKLTHLARFVRVGASEQLFISPNGHYNIVWQRILRRRALLHIELDVM